MISMSFSIPNLMSSTSFGVIAGRLVFDPGRLTPLWFDRIPLLRALHTTSVPSFISRTSN